MTMGRELIGYFILLFREIWRSKGTTTSKEDFGLKDINYLRKDFPAFLFA